MTPDEAKAAFETLIEEALPPLEEMGDQYISVEMPGDIVMRDLHAILNVYAAQGWLIENDDLSNLGVRFSTRRAYKKQAREAHTLRAADIETKRQELQRGLNALQEEQIQALDLLSHRLQNIDAWVHKETWGPPPNFWFSGDPSSIDS